MSTEIIEQRKKGKKSYDQLLEEYRKLFSKTANLYIPELAYALKEESPELTNREIKNRLIADLDGINTKLTIEVYMPRDFKDQERSDRQSKINFDRAERKRQEAIEILRTASKQLPKAPEMVEAESEDEEPDLDIGEPMLREYGDNEESVLSLYANINNPARELFKALTKKDIPGPIDDLVLEYLKPSREYRKGIFYEVDKNMRASLYNVLAFTRDAIDDTLKLLDAIDNQEGKLNE